MIWNIIKALAALAAFVIGVLLVFGPTTGDTGVSQVDAGVNQVDTQRTSEERQTDDEIITSQVCSQETCIHDHSSREYTMEYSSELNLNSGLGLGTFLGKTLLERQNAKLLFKDDKNLGGASVVISWSPKNILL